MDERFWSSPPSATEVPGVAEVGAQVSALRDWEL